MHYAQDVGDLPEGSFCFVDVMVDPDFRRQGFHTRLLEIYRNRAEAMGCRAIYATVDPDNIPSRKSFEKAGYLPLLIKPAYDGRPRVYYRLLLPADGASEKHLEE